VGGAADVAREGRRSSAFGHGRRGPRPHADRPIPATCKILERSGMTIDDPDLTEANEAFAPGHPLIERL
jgi:acetyl-CoA acetyltransferase